MKGGANEYFKTKRAVIEGGNDSVSMYEQIIISLSSDFIEHKPSAFLRYRRK